MARDTDLTLYYKFDESKSLNPIAGLGPELDCTRATTATYFDDSGVLQSVAANVARFDHLPVSPFTSLGLLVEKGVTNEVLHSTDFGHADWTWNTPHVEHGDSSETCPDGSTDGEEIIETAASGQQYYVKEAAGFTASTLTHYTSSVYVKPGTRDWVAIQFYGGGVNNATWFDVTNGTIGTEFGGVDHKGSGME